MRLLGKIAIVTGGSRDIGREVSIKLASEGAKIVVNYFNKEEDAFETKRLIDKISGECMLVYGDMTKWNEVERLVSKSVEMYGSRLDILVNVAGGLCGRKPIEEQNEEWYNLVMDLNLKSVFLTTKAVLKQRNF